MKTDRQRHGSCRNHQPNVQNPDASLCLRRFSVSRCDVISALCHAQFYTTKWRSARTQTLSLERNMMLSAVSALTHRADNCSQSTTVLQRTMRQLSSCFTGYETIFRFRFSFCCPSLWLGEAPVKCLKCCWFSSDSEFPRCTSRWKYSGSGGHARPFDRLVRL